MCSYKLFCILLSNTPDMKHAFALLLAASLMAMACSSSKKTQSSSTNTSNNTDAGSGSGAKKLDRSDIYYGMLDANTFELTGISDDTTYGYTSQNAIKVGRPGDSGPTNERRYLNALLGPNGEAISYVRRGSCCGVKSEYGLMGWAMIDIYIIKYDGLQEPITLYLNMYDPGDLKAPKGFTFKK